jgi:hypothetical protein
MLFYRRDLSDHSFGGGGGGIPKDNVFAWHIHSYQMISLDLSYFTLTMAPEKGTSDILSHI